MSTKTPLLPLAFFFLCFGLAGAQQPAATASGTIPIDELIKRASERQREYSEVFKDLRADETKIAEVYEDKGVKRRREIVSDLFVYQSPLDQTAVVEYRNARIVDGKPLGDADRRAEKLFERLAKAKDLKAELAGLDKESRRFDLNASFYGFTLNQGGPLVPFLIPLYKFIVVGGEQIDGRSVIVVEYKRTVPNENYKIDLSNQLKGAAALDRGRLYLDRDTLRLRRHEVEVFLEHPSYRDPFVVFKWEFNYGESPFGILTPTNFTMIMNARAKDRPDGTPELLVSSKVAYRYGPFTRFDVKAHYKPN